MFIKFKDVFFDEAEVKMVKVIGPGVRVTTPSGTYDITDVPEDDIEVFKSCFTIRRRRYDNYADYHRSRPSEPPKEDAASIDKYKKINELEEVES